MQTPRIKEAARSGAWAALDAAAPFLLAEDSVRDEFELMRWKLAALAEWSAAMIDQSYYPQYGRDVKTILDVATVEEAQYVDALSDEHSLRPVIESIRERPPHPVHIPEHLRGIVTEGQGSHG